MGFQALNGIYFVHGTDLFPFGLNGYVDVVNLNGKFLLNMLRSAWSIILSGR